MVHDAFHEIFRSGKPRSRQPQDLQAGNGNCIPFCFGILRILFRKRSIHFARTFHRSDGHAHAADGSNAGFKHCSADGQDYAEPSAADLLLESDLLLHIRNNPLVCAFALNPEQGSIRRLQTRRPVSHDIYKRPFNCHLSLQ